MKIIDASYEILDPLDGVEILQKIERIGRICYKSEQKITDTSAEPFVKMLIDRGHEAMLEHYSFSVKFIVDRGVSHEIVRHRIASFAQESTRYCNYGKQNEITVVKPAASWYGAEFHDAYNAWMSLCLNAEHAYLHMLNKNCSPQEARAVLPNSLKTEIVVTANLREWRHILKLRTAAAAHPDIRAVMRPLCLELKSRIPVVFDSITWQ